MYTRGEFEESKKIIIDCMGEEAAKHIFTVIDEKGAWKQDDNGYSLFLKTVNEELGQPVYSTEDNRTN